MFFLEILTICVFFWKFINIRVFSECFFLLCFLLEVFILNILFQKVEQLEKRLASITVICRLSGVSATAAKVGNKPEEEAAEKNGEAESEEPAQDKDGVAAVTAAAAEVEGHQRRVVGLKLKWRDDSEELLGSLTIRPFFSPRRMLFSVLLSRSRPFLAPFVESLAKLVNDWI